MRRNVIKICHPSNNPIIQHEKMEGKNKNTGTKGIAHNLIKPVQNTRGNARDGKERKQHPTTEKQSNGRNTERKILKYKSRKGREETQTITTRQNSEREDEEHSQQ